MIVGDGTYLLNPTELITALQERIKITIVLLDNRGFGCIENLSEAVGCAGFGTQFRERSASGQLDGEVLQTDFVANAKSLGAHAVKVRDVAELRAAIAAGRTEARTSVIVVETTRASAPRYDAWFDCAIAEVSGIAGVARAREGYEAARQRERHYLSTTTIADT